MENNHLSKEKQPFLLVNQLFVSTGKQARVVDFSHAFFQQSLTVLIGSNGAGKSSLLGALAGVVQKDSGQVTFDKQPEGRKMAFLPAPAMFYSHLTVQEQLAFHAGRFGLLPINIKQAMEQWQLKDRAHQRTNRLSLGYRQRLALAQVWMQRPDCILLDEPMNGMDIELMGLFKSQLKVWKQHACIIMASHLLDQVDDVADHWVAMSRGQSLASGDHDGQTSLYQQYQAAMQKESV